MKKQKPIEFVVGDSSAHNQPHHRVILSVGGREIDVWTNDEGFSVQVTDLADGKVLNEFHTDYEPEPAPIADKKPLKTFVVELPTLYYSMKEVTLPEDATIQEILDDAEEAITLGITEARDCEAGKYFSPVIDGAIVNV